MQKMDLHGLSMYDAIKLNLSGSTVETAISYYGKKYSFDQVIGIIDVLADNFAAEFSLGKGDTVTLCVPNSPAALLAFYAANKLGVAVNLVHPYLPPEKLAEIKFGTKGLAIAFAVLGIALFIGIFMPFIILF